MVVAVVLEAAVKDADLVAVAAVLARVTLGALWGLLGWHILCDRATGEYDYKQVQKCCFPLCFKRLLHSRHPWRACRRLPRRSRMHSGGALWLMVAEKARRYASYYAVCWYQMLKSSLCPAKEVRGYASYCQTSS